MKASIVVPLFNAEAYLERCLRALLAQDYPHERYEIVVVDNNSTDRTAQIVRRHPRITLAAEAKQGSYAARNHGTRLATGDVIVFTDPDCEPDPGWLSALMHAMGRREQMIVLGRCVFVSGSRALSMLADYDAVAAGRVFSSGVESVYFGYANNMAVRKALLDDLGGFLELDRGADTVLVQETVRAYGCDAVALAPDARARHLEIGGVRDFYRKRLIYGRSTERNRPLGSARPVSMRERLGVFSRTIRENDYSPGRALQLLALLGLGVLCYNGGRWHARWLDEHARPGEARASAASQSRGRLPLA